MRMRVRSPRKINGNRQQAGRQKEQAKTTTATRTVQSSLSLSPGPHKYRHAFADRIKIVALVFNARTRRYRSSHSSRRRSSSSHSTLFRNWLPGLLDSRRRWARGLRLKWQPGPLSVSSSSIAVAQAGAGATRQRRRVEAAQHAGGSGALSACLGYH